MTRHRSKRRRRPKTTAPPVPPRPPKRALAARIDERPKAPWHPFPLVEILVFAGIVFLAIGLFAGADEFIVLGVVLAALGGLDTAVREHFAGYRSHTLVLAAFPGVLSAVVLAVAGAPRYLIPPAMLVVFGAAFALFRRTWRRTAKRAAA